MADVQGEVLDSLDMFGVTARFPEQVAEAAKVAPGIEGLPAGRRGRQRARAGHGRQRHRRRRPAPRSAGRSCPVPIVVTKGYAPPSFVGPGTLCFAVSFSGNTEETLEAAQAAAVAGARMVVVTAGGELGALAPSWQAPHVPLPDRHPAAPGRPGRAVGAPHPAAREDRPVPGRRPDGSTRRSSSSPSAGPRCEAGEAAQQIARTIGRTIPLVFGAGPLGGVAAARWKAQVNENAKAPAFTGTYPELCHNEIVGWGQHGDVTRQVFTLVELRHDEEHPQEQRRFELVRDLMAEVVHDVIEVRAVGEGPLAQLFDLTLMGDYVSLHMAAQDGIDPGPIPVLDDLKRALAGP